jgi:hypothetical protein
MAKSKDPPAKKGTGIQALKQMVISRISAKKGKKQGGC